MAESLIEPLNAATPAAPVEVEPKEGVATPPAESDFPPELLKIPALQAIFAGSPPAASANIKTFAETPEGKLVFENAQGLMKAGMGLYRSLSGEIGVLFNQFHLHEDELKTADKAGQLEQIAPPFNVLNSEVQKSGEAHPILGHSGQLPPGFKQSAGTPLASAADMAPMSSGSPLPASAQNKLSAARTKNLSMGGPTSGPSPGAGRLVNAILKPVV